MSIYVIGDLHLSFNEDKPMAIFGNNWENHEKKIKEDWLKKVGKNDTVVLVGDFSWSMNLENAELDFKFINDLPGKKILLKGNHDYWWTTLKSMNIYIEEKNFKDIKFLYNNSYIIDDKVLVGTRGWNLIGDKENEKILKREVMRFELSIQDAMKKYGNSNEIIAFMHYPPIYKSNIIKNEINDFIRIMKKYNIKKCYYGHLHANSIKDAVNTKYLDIDFKLVSADGMNFSLAKI